MARINTAELEIVRIDGTNITILQNLEVDVFDGPIENEALRAYLAEPGHALFVGVRDGSVVAQIRGAVHRQPDRAAELYIDNLGVAPACKRQGIATVLVRTLLAWGRVQGCETVWVATEDDNDEAQAFYGSLGLHGRRMIWFETEINGSGASQLAE